MGSEQAHRKEPDFTAPDRPERVMWIAVACFALLVLAWFLSMPVSPAPPGAAMQIELPELEVPYDRFEVHAYSLNPPVLAIVHSADTWNGIAPRLFRFPDAHEISWNKPARLASAGTFDFNEDGTPDLLDLDNQHVRVRSGSSSYVLYAYADDSAWGQVDRAFPLPDLDGDGSSELALIHPRIDRSGFDFVLQDALFGVRSWVTIVRGRKP